MIGNRTKISDFLTIIPLGSRIGHGIMDVSIHRIGILGIGVLHFMRGFPIIHIIGDMGILIKGIITGDMAVVITIRVRLQHAIRVIKEVEIADNSSVQQDMEMADQEQSIMNKLALTGEILVQREALALKTAVQGQ